MANLCIIPARGGSKRIPRKNIRNFLGKPIIAYSIQIALESGLFDEIIVSTDDEEIAKIAIQHGASVPFKRSKKNADDHATLADVVEEVKQNYREVGKSFEYIGLLLPTAPLITKSMLKDAFELLKSKNGDSIRPIVPFSYPIQRALRLNNNHIEMINPQHRRTRSQDLESTYFDAGLFYLMRFDAGLIGDKKLGLEIKERYAQDIDTEEDWHIGEVKYRINNGLL